MMLISVILSVLLVEETRAPGEKLGQEKGDLLIQVSTWAGFTVLPYFLDYKIYQ
jgi:hypothetical protein